MNTMTEESDFPLPIESASHGSKRQRLVALLRGYCASPVIASLGEMGMAQRMLEGQFSSDDWESAANKKIVSATFTYLHSIGLIREVGIDKYVLTPEGRTAIGRSGAFSLLTSYADYFHQLPAILTSGDFGCTVNRLKNVHGSGQLHGMKFFQTALEFISADGPTAIIDIGCGDGCFLEAALKRWPGIDMVGVDLSQTAVKATKHRFRDSNNAKLIVVEADGFDVAAWSNAVPRYIRSNLQLIISLWFVGHEFSKGSPTRVVEFFTQLHTLFPQARIIVAEINNIPSSALAEDHDLSIMPEFLFFHELSGQGVLSWTDWARILRDIPYVLVAERRFDEVQPLVGDSIPASFIWLLQSR